MFVAAVTLTAGRLPGRMNTQLRLVLRFRLTVIRIGRVVIHGFKIIRHDGCWMNKMMTLLITCLYIKKRTIISIIDWDSAFLLGYENAAGLLFFLNLIISSSRTE